MYVLLSIVPLEPFIMHIEVLNKTRKNAIKHWLFLYLYHFGCYFNVLPKSVCLLGRSLLLRKAFKDLLLGPPTCTIIVIQPWSSNQPGTELDRPPTSTFVYCVIAVVILLSFCPFWSVIRDKTSSKFVIHSFILYMAFSLNLCTCDILTYDITYLWIFNLVFFSVPLN